MTFLDTMLQMIVVGLSGRSLRLPTRIRSVCVDPTVHQERVTEYGEGNKGIEIKHVHRPTTNTHTNHLRMPLHFFKTVFLPSLHHLAVVVHVNRCLDNIVAGGVQICGLHATVAPRRQQQQSPPTLEEFLFVPYLETECLSANEKLGDQLKNCKG